MPLQLLRLLPSRRTSNRVWLIFNDSSKLPFFIDDVVTLGLKTNLEISDELYGKIKSTSLYYLLYNYALNQVAISPKISQILSPKIKQKLRFYLRKYKLTGDYDYLIDQITDKLLSLNLLDEFAYANYLLRKNKNRSRQYISRLFSHYHLTLPQDYQPQDTNNIKEILLKKKYSSLDNRELQIKATVMY